MKIKCDKEPSPVIREENGKMKFQQYNLGNLKGGEIVEVKLSGNSSNVKLMDSSILVVIKIIEDILFMEGMRLNHLSEYLFLDQGIGM